MVQGDFTKQQKKVVEELVEVLQFIIEVFNLHLYKTDSGGGKCYIKAQRAIAKAKEGLVEVNLEKEV